MLGGIYTALLALVIFGGRNRKAKIAEKIVPFMALGYILVAILILGLNVRGIPQIFALIFSSAFSFHAVFGAMIGNAILWGVMRGCFSNESGTGYGALVSGYADVPHPAQQGLA